VSNNDTVAAGKGYVEEFEVPYAMAHAPEVWELYDVPYQPVTVVLDDDGRIARRVDGSVTYDQLKSILEKVVAQTPSASGPRGDRGGVWEAGRALRLQRNRGRSATRTVSRSTWSTRIS
jgi:hypothetical protein